MKLSNLSNNFLKFLKKHYIVFSWISAIALGSFMICLAVFAKQDKSAIATSSAEIKAEYADAIEKCPLPEFGTNIENEFFASYPDSSIFTNIQGITPEDMEALVSDIQRKEEQQASCGDENSNGDKDSADTEQNANGGEQIAEDGNTSSGDAQSSAESSGSETVDSETTSAAEETKEEPTYEEFFAAEKPFEKEFRKYNAEADGFTYLKSIPLDKNVQKYIYFMSRKYGVEYAVVLAVMDHESRFQYNATSKSGTDHGLMQINERNSEYLYNNIGVTDINNPYQNIQSGVWMLSCFLYKYEDTTQALMAYNCGEGGAKKLWANGQYSSAYSEAVLEEIDGYRALLA